MLEEWEKQAISRLSSSLHLLYSCLMNSLPRVPACIHSFLYFIVLHIYYVLGTEEAITVKKTKSKSHNFLSLLKISHRLSIYFRIKTLF